MLNTDTEVFLPISETTLSSVISDDTNLGSVLSGLSVPEIASLFLVENLPKLLQGKSLFSERFLERAIDGCLRQSEVDGFPQFVAHASANLSRTKISDGYELFPTFKIGPIDDAAVKQRDYIAEDGGWDFGFQERYKLALTERLAIARIGSSSTALSPEQSRIYREFESQQDEHMHIQGYAGTGKTFLIRSLLSMFESSSAQILILAERKIQLDAVNIGSQGMGHVHKLTFFELAKQIIPHDLTSPVSRNLHRDTRSRTTMPDDEIIKHLGIYASGTYQVYKMVRAVRGTLYRYCQSDDDELNEAHVPKQYNNGFDAATQQAVCHYATELWKATLSPPSKEFRPPIRGYHLIKWAALNRCSVPRKFTHVLVDESHNLPKSIVQLLGLGSQARLSLGDEYQNMRGVLVKPRSMIRQREMNHSVRSSHQIEEFINPVLQAHPGTTNVRFLGNKESRLTIEYYDKPVVPQTPTLILVNDAWGLFEWSQRLTAGNVNIKLMDDRENLNTFAQDCIELFTQGTRARHGELFRYASWANVANDKQNNRGFTAVDRMLEKGYAYKDWRQTYTRLSQNSEYVHSLARIENVRNREFDCVMLTPDFANASKKLSRAAFCSLVYVSSTRAMKKLIVPITLRHWIEEMSASSNT